MTTANITNERILAARRLLREFAYEAMKFELVTLPTPHVISHMEMQDGRLIQREEPCGCYIFHKATNGGYRCQKCMPHPDLSSTLKNEIERISNL